ncbi:MAG: Fe(3+) ABC transporter substrate-binding protein [Hyphomonadaceae bacterium]|nr:Fe(3+) ABC transporter substrate-binding protein [Hyphomonadaceae bacterium]
MKFKSWIAGILAASVFSGCGDNRTTGATGTPKTHGHVQELNLYSARHYDTDMALYDDFTRQTGIRVNLIESRADALIERIKNEGEFSPADILITVDAGRLWRAEQADILSPLTSSVLEQRIPAHLRDPDGRWFGLSKRARVIIYNKAAGKPESLMTYADLANSVHADRVCMRSSSNIYNISLMAAMISHMGAAAAEDWGVGVADNFARRPQGNDTAQIEAVAGGECGISIVNTYYIARYANSDDFGKRKMIDSIGIIFPDQSGIGTHVNISGAGIIKTAPNRDAAVKFLEYLTSDSAQAHFANGNNEYPVVETVAPNAAVKALGVFREDEINVSELGENQNEAVRIYDRIGWP